MAETVVTEFVLATGEYDAALASATQGMSQYDKTADEATKANAGFSGSLGSMTAKVNTYRTAMDAAGKSTAAVAGESRKIGASTGLVDRLAGAWTRVKDGASNALGSVRTGLNNAAGSVKGFFSGIMNGVSSAVPGLGSVTGMFSGMAGPIGVAAAAVVGFISNFSRLDSVATALDGVRIQFDIILDRLANFDFNGFFDPATMARDAAAAQGIANEMDRLVDVQLDVNRANAQAEVQLASMNQQLRDRTKSEAERLAIADQITKVERARADEELKYLQQSVALEKFRANIQQQTLGEVSDERKAALNEAEVALLQAQARSIALTEATERRRNLVLEEGENERKRIADKAAVEEERNAQKRAAAREKAAKEAEAQAKALAAAEAGVNGVVLAATRERELAQLSAFAREEAIVREGYQKQIDAAKKAFEELRKLTPEGDSSREEVTAREAEAIATIEANLATKLAEIRKQDEEDVRRSLLTKEEIQREAINKEYDEKIATAERVLAGDAELGEARLELERQRLAALNAVVDADEAARIEKLKADQQQRLDIITSTGEQIAGVVQSFTSGQIENGKEAAKALATIALDTLEKVVNIKIAEASVTALAAPDSVATFGAAGLARGAVIAALIKAAFAAVRGLISGAYTGERNIGGNGEAPIWSGRDGYIRRVDKGEDIIAANRTRKYRPILDMVHNDTLDKWLKGRMPGYGMGGMDWVSSIAVANGYVERSRSSTSHHHYAGDTMDFNDRRIVGALGVLSSGKEQRKQTEILRKMAVTRNRNPRYR